MLQKQERRGQRQHKAPVGESPESIPSRFPSIANICHPYPASYQQHEAENLSANARDVFSPSNNEKNVSIADKSPGTNPPDPLVRDSHFENLHTEKSTTRSSRVVDRIMETSLTVPRAGMSSYETRYDNNPSFIKQAEMLGCMARDDLAGMRAVAESSRDSFDCVKSERYPDTPFLVAVKAGDVELARILVKYGADIDAADVQGNTGLYIAVEQAGNQCNPVDIRLRSEINVALLLASNANVNLATRQSTLNVACAAKPGCLDHVVEELIAKGADVNRADIQGDTPLTSAIHAENCPVVSVLIRHGAVINGIILGGRNKNRTYLEIALNRCSFQMIALLLRHGADPTILDINFILARRQARCSSDCALIQSIREYLLIQSAVISTLPSSLRAATFASRAHRWPLSLSSLQSAQGPARTRHGFKKATTSPDASPTGHGRPQRDNAIAAPSPGIGDIIESNSSKINEGPVRSVPPNLSCSIQRCVADESDRINPLNAGPSPLSQTLNLCAGRESSPHLNNFPSTFSRKRRFCSEPMSESAILTNEPESDNNAYTMLKNKKYDTNCGLPEAESMGLVERYSELRYALADKDKNNIAQKRGFPQIQHIALSQHPLAQASTACITRILSNYVLAGLDLRNREHLQQELKEALESFRLNGPALLSPVPVESLVTQLLSSYCRRNGRNGLFYATMSFVHQSRLGILNLEQLDGEHEVHADDSPHVSCDSRINVLSRMDIAAIANLWTDVVCEGYQGHERANISASLHRNATRFVLNWPALSSEFISAEALAGELLKNYVIENGKNGLFCATMTFIQMVRDGDFGDIPVPQ